MTEALCRHGMPSTVTDPPREAAPWAVLVLALAATLATTTNPILIGVCAVLTGISSWLLAGPRRAIWRLSLALGCLALLWRVLSTLLVGGTQTGSAILQLPSWQPAPGTSFGGTITAGVLVVALTEGVKALTAVALLGLAWQARPGDDWLAAARRLLGRGAELVAPWCFLGEGVSAAWEASRVRSAQGWSFGSLTRAMDAFRLAGVAANVAPGPRPSPAWAKGLRPVALLLPLSVPALLALGLVPTRLSAPLSSLGVTLLSLVPALVLLLAGTRAHTLTLCAVLALAALLGRAWLPGAAALAWSPADGWPEAPYAALAATLALPIAAALTHPEATRA